MNAAALLGSDIRIFPQPDETIATRRGTGTYVEALDLPHLIVRDGDMWVTQRNVVAEPGAAGVVGKSYFASYTGLDIFANAANADYADAPAVSKAVQAQIMSTDRHKRLQWIASGRFQRVYDSDAPDALDDLVAALHAGARFKMRIDLENGVSQIHPVTYPFDFAEDDTLQADTEIQYVPNFMHESRAALLAGLGERAGLARDYTDVRGHMILQ